MTHTCKWKRVVTHSWNDDVRALCKRAMSGVSYMKESRALPSIWRSHVTMSLWVLRLAEDVKRDWTPIFTNYVTHWNESSHSECVMPHMWMHATTHSWRIHCDMTHLIGWLVTLNVSCHTHEYIRWGLSPPHGSRDSFHQN